MFIQLEPGYLAVVAGVQVVGLLGAALTRLVEHGWTRALCQAFFFIWMGLAGLGTLAMSRPGSQIWLMMGTSLAIAAVAATLDLKPQKHRSPF